MKLIKHVAMTGGLLAGAVLFAAQPVLAHGDESQEAMEGHSHEKAEIHGGEVTMTPHHHFETLFTPDGIRLYVYDENQKPVMSLKDAKASVVLQSKDGKSESIPLTYLPPDTASSRTQPCFAASHEFGAIQESTMKGLFAVQGLGKEPIQFKTPVSMMQEKFYTCTMHPEVRAEDPGKCPKCGMNLVPEESGKASGKMDGDSMHHAHQDSESGQGKQ